MDVWSWICDLPNSLKWSQSNTQLVYELAASNNTTSKGNSTRSIQLKAERSSELKPEVWITFSIFVEGFHFNESSKTIWLSDPCPLSSDKPFLPLVLQLIQETINRAPITYHDHTHQGRSQLMKVKPDPIIWILETFSPESFSGFFNMLLFMRLFWLCACDAPSEVGSIYFHSMLAPNLEILSRASHVPVLKGFMAAAGVDVELCISRVFGYMLTKWLITREMRVGLSSLLPLPSNLGISYASESCGLWLLKGYVPVWAMKRTCSSDKEEGFQFVGAKESALKYSLAHQQLEVNIQLEYKVEFFEGHIQVSARVDNIRLHMVKLGFNKNEDSKEVEYREELYFPSRIEFWVGPEIGSNYVTSLSLGKSTTNIEREVETQKLVKGSFGKLKNPKVKTMSRTSTKMKMKNWRCDQDVEGSAAIFDAVFYDNTNGIEVYSTKLNGGGGYTSNSKPKDDLGKRYSRVNRPFMKSGGLVFTGNEYGEEVKWRLSKEMEGSMLKWRIGSKIWVTYWPSDIESSYYETRFIDWSDEVDLPLIPSTSN